MAPSRDDSSHTRFSRIANLIAVAADVALVGGVAFAFLQINQSNRFEHRRVAIDATTPTRSPEFLTAYSKIVDAWRRDPTMSSVESLRDDLTYVMNVYDNIAVLCLSELADEDLVRKRIHSAMKTLVPILNATRWPAESRANFDALLRQFDNSH